MVKWITPHTINHYFRIHHYQMMKLRVMLKGTPHIKKSGVQCSGYPGKEYYLYDLDHLLNGLGLIELKPIPNRLIIQ